MGILLGVVAFWLVVVFTLDHYFEVHYDQSYAITGQIVLVSIVVWLVVGLAAGLLVSAR